jgi:catechol 2,3-dioxygenase-like lactoylglutathione lyase family enzyme
MSAIPDIDLDHVAVATERQAEAWPRYAADLGGQWIAGGGEMGFAAAQLRFANGMKIEVLEPFEVERNDFLRRFLDRSGPGPHHMTFKVADIRLALQLAEGAGYRPVNVNLSFPDWQEAFLHPKDAPGVVVQLAQSTGSWQSPPPSDFPKSRLAAPATLVHVGHAVADLAEGRRLFVDLLGGKEIDSDDDAEMRWVDVAWPGPGRVRLIEPSSPTAPLSQWIGERAGRVHHLAFAVPDPGSVEDAIALGDGVYEIEPEANLGTRLLLAEPTDDPFPRLPPG